MLLLRLSGNVCSQRNNQKNSKHNLAYIRRSQQHQTLVSETREVLYDIRELFNTTFYTSEAKVSWPSCRTVMVTSSSTEILCILLDLIVWEECGKLAVPRSQSQGSWWQSPGIKAKVPGGSPQESKPRFLVAVPRNQSQGSWWQSPGIKAKVPGGSPQESKPRFLVAVPRNQSQGSW